MLHRHTATTTSFIVSSDESLNKPSSLSSASACGRSTDSSENMSTTTATSASDSHTDQAYFSRSSTDSIPANNIVISNNRHSIQPANGRFAMLPPQPVVPPPPPPIPLGNQDECFSDKSSYSFNSQQHATSQIEPESPEKIYGVNLSSPIATGLQSTHGSQNITESNYKLSKSFGNIAHQPIQAPLMRYTNQNNPNLVNSFHNKTNLAKDTKNQRHHSSSLDQLAQTPLIAMNVKGMLLHGLSSEEVMRNWLLSLKCDDLLKNFTEHGYDIHLITRMTPQDLAAIGCRSPVLRKKLLAEIKKLNLDYDLADYKPMILEQWLDTLKLKTYYTLLISEGYDTVEKVCQLTWEDLEEIGITKLGHQKRLLMGIDKVQKSLKVQEERLNDSAIYDVHPNHRLSLHSSTNDGRMNTIGRVRSGLFQTRSGANLDHRGLPVATVMPALKHISGPIINSPDAMPAFDTMRISNDSQKSQVEAVKMSDLATTLKRNPPPLPPVRTNSLKFAQGINGQPIYDLTYRVETSSTNTAMETTQLSNSSNFSQNSTNDKCPQFQTTQSRGSINPVREAPLPPHMQHRLSVPPTIEEKPSESNGAQSFAAGPGIVCGDDFPPPPP